MSGPARERGRPRAARRHGERHFGRLDVTVQAEIDAAVKKITKDGRGLYGIVNNAGVAIVAPLIEVDEDDLQFQIDVNVFGPYRVTKAFAPLIIEAKGRITTIGSISGILSGTLFGPYSMTKHAMEAFADSLAREMERFDVKVSIVEPGNYKSKIGDSLKKRMDAKGVDFENSAYKDEMERMMARVGEADDEKEPDEVAEAVYHALFDENPKMRYMVVPIRAPGRDHHRQGDPGDGRTQRGPALHLRPRHVGEDARRGVGEGVVGHSS